MSDKKTNFSTYHSQDTRYKGPLDIAPTVSSTYGTGGNNQPFVASAGFCTEHSAKSHGIGYEEELSPTLRAGVVPATVLSEETPKTLKVRCGREGGGKGALIQENKSATLSCNNDQSVFIPSAYGICSKDSNSMKSNNPHSGIYKADTSRTLDGNANNPSCNQGGIAIVESYSIQGSMIGRDDKNGPQGNGVNKNISFTLNATDKHAVAMETFHCTTEDEKSMPLKARDYKDPNIVCFAIDRETFNCGQNFARNLGISEDGVASTLNTQGPSAVAHSFGFYPQMKAESVNMTEDRATTLVNGTNPGYQNGVVNEYTVRRLTPTECARLQGFPDWWCEELSTDNPTEDDITFWSEVFETHRKTVGGSDKPKTRAQVIKWLKNPHSDSAEYKMWGNGVSLPCVVFVLARIMCAEKKKTQSNHV